MDANSVGRVLVILLPLLVIVVAIIGIRRVYSGRQSGVVLQPLSRRDVIGLLGISATFVGVFAVALSAGASFRAAQVLLVGAVVPLMTLAWRVSHDRRQ